MSPWETAVKIVKENRKRTPLRAKIDKIPRYDWLKDPNKWRVEGKIPKERCHHCGWKFLDHEIAPFCVVCFTHMWTDSGEVPKNVKNRLRVPEDYNFETNQVENKDHPAIFPKFTRADNL